MSKTLVAYFSVSGTTRKVAQNLAEVAHADLYEITPKKAYTRADLNWTDPKARSTVESKDHYSRPELKDHDAHIADYDTIYLGFPIWWYVAPHIINTFLESYDFSNKKIIVFATSGGSGFGHTLDELRNSASPSVKWVMSEILNRQPSKEKLEKYVQKYN